MGVISFVTEQIVRRFRRPLDEPAHEAGERGELEAMWYLQKLGFTVAARRLRMDGLRGEVDLIAWEGPVLCFVEVKTRAERTLVDASLAVDREKQNAMRAIARRYVGQLPWKRSDDRDRLETRFDTVTVYLDSLPDGIAHQRNAFR